MYVCLCHGIAESHVREAAEIGVRSVAAICKALGVRPQCAKCVPAIRKLLREAPAATRARLEEGATAA